CTTTATSSSPVGNYPITCSGQTSVTYAITDVPGTLTVSPAPLTITANNASKTYGTALTFAGGTGFATSTLYNADKVASVTLTSAGAAAISTVISPGPTYSVTPSAATGTGLSNYIITYAPGTLTVNPAPLTITANNASKNYGAVSTFPSGTGFTTGTLYNADNVASVILTSAGAAATATVTSPGPTYSITPSAATGAGLGNYIITYVNGTLTVNPAPLTITANNASKTYGTTVTFAAGTGFTTGTLYNGDKVASVTLTSAGAASTATVTSPGPTYAITPSAATGTGLGNYAITYANSTLTVNPAPLTITANNAIKNYGAMLTFVGTEFTTGTRYNADRVASVTLISAGAAATATVASPGPIYSISSSSAIGTGLGNYTITYANGTLAVNKDNTSTSLVSSLNPSLPGQSVVFTATVSNTSGTPAVPAGSVQFMDGASPLGAPQPVSGVGKATLTTSTLTVATHPITAIYSNSDGNFINSTSAGLSQVVEDFSITVTPATETISSGHQATYTVALAPINGLTGSVALSCSGAPPNSTCAISPSTVGVPGSVSPTVTLSPNKSVSHGTFTLTISGTLVGSSLTHSAAVQLTVQ
ncbi:MAG TPA: MBG domain-containing protein, partial [Candidatus Acidoferrum sp.]